MAKRRRKMDPRETAPRRHQLLDRVLGIYRHTLESASEPRAFLNTHGIRLDCVPAGQLPGFSDGSLVSSLPQHGGVREELTGYGILQGDGSELLGGCLVFPLSDVDGMVVSLGGVETAQGHVSRLDRSPAGAWNLQAAASISS